MLGISVYLGNDIIKDFDTYLNNMQKAGFTSIFTSLHIPEDDPTKYTERLRALGAAAKRGNMELMADISPKSLGHLGFTWENAAGLLEWGVTGLRLDYGISEETMIKLSKKMKIALNASTLTKEILERLKANGLQTDSVEAWHNFYPRPETGLDKQEFQKVNNWLKQEGLTVMAFIPGDADRRGPLFEGLPTLEDHRHSTPFEAYLDLITNCAVEKILVGDLNLTEKTLSQFTAYQKGILKLRAKPFTANKELCDILSTIQTNRWDAARDCIRSIESREYGLIGTRPVTPKNTVERPIGSITIDNEKYGRYQGEIQITKRDLKADEKVNVIGQVITEDQPLLQYISGGMKFQIEFVQ
ncbi:DUF871 domain-containing protein [Sporosarcina sp. Marseille-Q4063]|uniref:DUF871 domain-containing protein n=1 Tax=Sporosarcina sp. Marseille-Q4063 TaxID=2810514 RepID=UPI001BAF9EE7|nr:MupG family TIM beta-alpha barrel fold protein [Sporosarcina sp. Marseille-Q4063]QUW21238.1 DUF871 domain-containing protein [Sporosarcina sp. Marseille-Q4063]